MNIIHLLKNLLGLKGYDMICVLCAENQLPKLQTKKKHNFSGDGWEDHKSNRKKTTQKNTVKGRDLFYIPAPQPELVTICAENSNQIILGCPWKLVTS